MALNSQLSVAPPLPTKYIPIALLLVPAGTVTVFEYTPSLTFGISPVPKDPPLNHTPNNLFPGILPHIVTKNFSPTTKSLEATKLITLYELPAFVFFEFSK